jgi:serine protease Do
MSTRSLTLVEFGVFGFGALIGASGVLVLQDQFGPVAMAEELANPPLEPLSYDPRFSLAPLVERLGPAVVHLQVTQAVPAAPAGFPFFSGMAEGEVLRKGEGSGFFVSADGYLVTNNHVVDEAREVRVRFADGRSMQGEVVGTDPRTDIALVKVKLEKGTTVPFVPLGQSSRARVGDQVVAIGAPFGLDHTVTTGIISAKGRNIGAGPYDDFIQTDASINPGNSGGPLFNLYGEVVGVNTAINPRGQGIGFAVPSDMVADIIEQLKTDGKVARGWMGVGLQPLSPEEAKKLKIPKGSAGSLEGAVVVGAVYANTPAAKADLRAGDLVVALEGKPLSGTEALIREVGRHAPGETLRLSVLREGETLDLKVQLGERPEEDALQAGRFR